MMRCSRFVPPIFGLLFAAGAALYGQGLGDAPNYEEVRIKPLTLATVGDREYLLVCNTPDSSVEIYDTADDSFVARVPVGQGPVSVVWHPRLGRFYTANMFGDSISIVRLEDDGTGLRIFFDRTTFVGDEPWHIAFYTVPGTGSSVPVHLDNLAPVDLEPGRETLIVTRMTPDSFGWYDAVDLTPITTESIALHAETPVDETITLALKEPRTAAVLADAGGDQLVMIATKGSNDVYLNDIYCSNFQTGELHRHGGLGSTNANLTLDSAGRLYVVGGRALNRTHMTGPVVASATTGFVKSMIHVVEDVCSEEMTVQSRDLNAVPGQTALNPVSQLEEPVPVLPRESLAMPVDVAVFEQGNTRKIFIAAFSVDRIGLLTASATQPIDQWPLKRIDISPIDEPAGSAAPTAAPRGLALKTSDPPRLYVLNHNDNSVTVIHPASEKVLRGFRLRHDPRPPEVRDGHPFIAGAKLSGNGFVSCFSCHFDMRGDRLIWDLGDDNPNEPTIPVTLVDGVAFTTWSSAKGPMVTQTLQGLLNWQVNEEARELFSNAPYHWRADRSDVESFNEAFASLLGGAELPVDDLARMGRYVRSILYPGNPKQRPERRYSGDFGDPAAADDPSVGTLAQHGMKLFHLSKAVGNRSCVICHALPDGSNNLLTDGIFQPAESAALRHVFQREGRADKGPEVLPEATPLTGIVGLTHGGFLFDLEEVNAVASIDAFNRTAFSAFFCGTAGAHCQDLEDLDRFVREFDTGTSRTAGAPFTVDSGTDLNLAAIVTSFLEGQVKLANIGLAVHVWSGGTFQGYWYDPSGPTAVYRSEPDDGAPRAGSGSFLPFLQGPDDRLVFQATPLGSQRRLAASDGTASAQPAVAPNDLAVLPWRPNTAHADVPKMTVAWAEIENPGFYLHVVRTLQQAILDGAAAAQAFGLSGLRHEAPRRAVVAGRGIRQGAMLELHFPNDPNRGAVKTALSPEDPEQIPTRRVTLPIHPTGELDAAGRPVWQSSAELDPLQLYVAMLGGEFALGVQEILNDTAKAITDPGPTVAPMSHGFIHYRVVNPGDRSVHPQVSVDVGWDRITLSHHMADP